jgi:DNA gyrase subunit A
VLCIRQFAEDKYFLFATKRGMVKRSAASLYARCRKTGITAVTLHDDDELMTVCEVKDDDYVVLATADGIAIRFSCRDVRGMGRGAAGVKGIALRHGDMVVSCLVMAEPANGKEEDFPEILTISALGYGKRTRLNLYRVQSRGGKGIINFRVTPKTGRVIGALPVTPGLALVLLSSNNKIMRMAVDEIRTVGRAAIGVRLVRLDEGGKVIGFDTVSLERLDDMNTEEVHPEGVSDEGPAPEISAAQEDAE